MANIYLVENLRVSVEISEAQTPLRLVVSRCLTRVNVGHFYDTRTTCVSDLDSRLSKTTYNHCSQPISTV